MDPQAPKAVETPPSLFAAIPNACASSVSTRQHTRQRIRQPGRYAQDAGAKAAQSLR